MPNPTPTRAQILAADDRTLDAWAAEYVMGKEITTNRLGYKWILIGTTFHRVPDYSHSHDHAHELVENVIKRGLWRQLISGIQSLNALSWPEDFDINNPDDTYYSVGLDCLTAAPRQITQAALLAVCEAQS
jgi:hypothetical protein